MSTKNTDQQSYIGLFVIVIIILIAVNQYFIMDIGQTAGVKFFKSFKSSNKLSLSGDLTKDAIAIALSKGVPEIYGEELGLEYIDPSQGRVMDQMMSIMKQYDPDYGRNKIVLEGDLKQRYIDVNIKISCEYCCSAKAIIFEDGKASCGCAHSQAMRGLTAYLLQNHADEFTNDQVLRELSRWKGLYYPKQTIKKLVKQLQSGEFTPDISALLLDIDVSKLSENLQDGDIPLPSEIKNLPSMAGGC